MISKTPTVTSNFTFIRLCFSIIIVLTHSYTLSGREVNDWIQELTNGQAFTAWLCFKCFFLMSGYLVIQSLFASRTLRTFLWKRFLRVYPALIVVLLLTLLYGQFVYESNTPYLQNKEVYTYLPNNLLMLDLQYSIAGIFDHNPYKSAINGSLWSLPYEVVFYILVVVFFFFRKNMNVTRILLLATFILLYLSNFYYEEAAANFRFYKLVGTYLLDLGTFFAGGALLGALRFEKFRYKNIALPAGIILLVLSFMLNSYRELQYISLPLIILPLGCASTRFIRETDRVIGDISYGVYIYSFPVQQTLVYYFKLDYQALMVSSLAISLLLGYASWHLVEKRFMKLKKLTYTQLLSYLHVPQRTRASDAENTL